LTLVLYLVLILKHRKRGYALVAPVVIIMQPVKLQVQESILYLGVLMTAFYALQLNLPELMTMADMFQTTYKAISYYYLMRFASLQFGQMPNIMRSDGTGTLQSHKPCKFWKKPPCCCVWIFCLPFMKDRVVNYKDGFLMYRFVYQFCIFGPILSAMKMAVRFEGVNQDNIATVTILLDVLTIVSLLCAVYGIQVLCGIVESCLPIQNQVRERTWFKNGHAALPEGESKEATPTKNISPKNAWITIVTVTPVMAGLIASFFITDNVCYDDAGFVTKVDYRSYINAFCGIILNLLGVIFAMGKAFPLPSLQDRSELLEQLSAKFLEMEIWPEYALKAVSNSINQIIETRKREGKEVGLKPSQAFMENFGALADAEIGKVAI